MAKAPALDHDQLYDIVRETVVDETRKIVGNLFAYSKTYAGTHPKGFQFLLSKFAALVDSIETSLIAQGIPVTLGVGVVKGCHENSVAHLIAVVYGIAVNEVAKARIKPLASGPYVLKSNLWTEA